MRSSKLALGLVSRALPALVAWSSPLHAAADPATPAPPPASAPTPSAAAAPATAAAAASAPVADPPVAADPAAVAPAPPAIAPGGYQGVTPGVDHLPPRPPRLPAAGPARVIWTGFQSHEGNSATVFVELSRPAAFFVDERPDASGKGSVLTFTLPGVRVPLSNNRRPLDVSAFGGPIQRVTTRKQGRDVAIVIEHTGKVTHVERTEAAAGGYKMLFIDVHGTNG